MKSLLDFCLISFFFNDTPTTEIYTLSLHDALPIFGVVLEHQMLPRRRGGADLIEDVARRAIDDRSEEHTSELQSRFDLVCRLLLEKKKKTLKNIPYS